MTEFSVTVAFTVEHAGLSEGKATALADNVTLASGWYARDGNSYELHLPVRAETNGDARKLARVITAGVLVCSGLTTQTSTIRTSSIGDVVEPYRDAVGNPVD